MHGAPFDMPSLLRVAVVRADGGDLVIAAVPYSSAADSLQVVAHGLIFGTPVLFIVFVGATWLAVGSTLRPIDRIRRGAARVTGTGVPADFPVPEARDEVRSLALTLNDMLSRLTSAQQRQRSLVSDTAHELRSPIASIRAQLEVALDHPAGQDWASTARDVLADTLRLSRLTEDLLLLARLDEQADHGDMGRHGEPLDLGELACAVVARYADSPVPVTVAPAEAEETTPADGATRLPTRRRTRTAGRDQSAPSQWRCGQPRPARPDARQPDRQRDPVRKVIGHGVGRPIGFVGGAGRDRRRSRHTRVRPGAGVRPLRPPRRRPHPLRRRRRGGGLGLAIVRATAQSHAGTAHLESSPDGASGLRAAVRLPPAASAP